MMRSLSGGLPGGSAAGGGEPDRRRTRGRAARAAGLLLVPGLLLGCGEGPSASHTTVRQGGFKVIEMAVPFVAKERGIFERNGLDWRYITLTSGKLGAAALISGNVELVDVGLDDIVNLRESGRDAILVFNVVNPLGMNLVIRNEALERAGVGPDSPLEAKLEALEGLKFGITRPGAGSHVYIQYLLLKAGLDPERDATFVQIGSPQAMVAATNAGRVDGFILSPPWPNLVEREGVGTVLLDNAGGEGPEEFRDFAFHSVAALRSYVEENPETVEAYIRSMREAFDWMSAHREETLRLLETYFPDTDPEVLALSYDAIVPAINGSGLITRTGIAGQLEVLQEVGVISSSPSSEEGVLWTNRYNPAAPSAGDPGGEN